MMLHDVRRVEVLEAHRLRLGFDDGTEGDVDMAVLGEWRATVAIDSVSVLSGELPPRVIGLVAEMGHPSPGRVA